MVKDEQDWSDGLLWDEKVVQEMLNKKWYKNAGYAQRGRRKYCGINVIQLHHKNTSSAI